MLPNALSKGVPYEIFFHLTPKKLEAFYKAHQIKMKEINQLAWLFNQYTMSAVTVAVDHNIHGEKAKSKYVEKPILIYEKKGNDTCKENREEVAIFEMKQRINILKKQGLPESPI